MKFGRALSDILRPLSGFPTATQGNGRFGLVAGNFQGPTYCIRPP